LILFPFPTTSLTFNNCTLCPHSIDVFCIYLRANSNFCNIHLKLIGFSNRVEKCLQRGTNWVCTLSSLRFVFKRLNANVLEHLPTLWNRQCSRTLAFKIHTPVNHPEESIQHSEHSESFKSRKIILVLENCARTD
jgi:hypothetical protein